MTAPSLRRTLGCLMLVGGLLSGIHLTRRLGTAGIYTDDFANDYASAQAILGGQSPYATSASVLIVAHLPAAKDRVMETPYAVPHTPVMGLLTVPFALFSYGTARALWLALEALLLLTLAALVPLPAGVLRKALVPIALLAWPPVAMELRFGNWSLVLAVLTVLVWRCHRAERPRGAGALLGLAIAIKLFPAVLVGFFVLKRAWRTTEWAIGVAVALTLAPEVVNSDLLLSYLHAGGQVPWDTLAHSFANYSALGAAARVVTTSHAFGAVPPIVSAPAWTLPLCTLTALILLWGTGRVARRSGDDVGFAVALCAATLLAPVAWQYYLCLLLWPLGLLATRLDDRGWPRAEARAFFAAFVLLSLPQQVVSIVALAPAAAWPPASALVLLLLPAGPLVLLSLLSTLDARGAVPMRQAVSSAREARVFVSSAPA
jgi:hypothetical protein